MNVLKPHLQTTIWTLLGANASQREIERVTGIDRNTIRTLPKALCRRPSGKLPRGGHRLELAAVASQLPPPRPPAAAA